MKKPRKAPADKVDFDNNLKEIIKEFFREALELLHPELADQVDWSRQPEFLEQELRRLIKAYFRGAKYCDLLVKLWLLSGEEKWVLVHWELEVNPGDNFGRRMLDYRMLIHLKHQVDDVAAIALYAGPKSAHQVDYYEHSFAGTVLTYRFSVYRAWEQDEAKLAASENPFAMVVLAVQYVLRTRKNFEDRLLFKEKLIELAQEKNLPEQKLARLLIFVDNFMFLPTKWENILKIRLARKITKIKEMTITQSNRDLAEIFYKNAFGILPQEMAEKIVEERIKAAEQKLAAEKKAAEQKLAAEKKAAEQKLAAEKKTAEKKVAQATEKIIKKSVLAFHSIGLGAEDIAAKLELDPKKVRQILSENMQ